MSNFPVRDHRQAEWFFVDNVLIDRLGKTIGVYGIAVYSVLARHSNINTQEAHPSYKTIAEKIGCSRRKVVEIIKQLEDLKVIKVQRGRITSSGDPDTNAIVLRNRGDWKLPPSEQDAGGSASGASGVVHQVHQGSAQDAPKQDLPNKTKEEQYLTPDEKEKIADDLFAELVFLLNQSVELMTINMKREYEGFIYDLFDLTPPARPGDIEHFGLWWYAEDWRGKKGQKPSLSQIRQHWNDAAGWDAEQAAKDSEVVAVY